MQTVGGAGALRLDFDAAYHMEESCVGPGRGFYAMKAGR